MYTPKGRLDNSTLIKQYSPLVRRLAHQMIAKLPANVELDDLIQVGMIGLTMRSRFDAEQGVQFETFATQRIRGAMLDELRGGDWMSRGTRRQQRDIEAAVHKVEQRLGRAPSEARSPPRWACRWPSTRTCWQGARHPAGLPGGHVRRRRRRDFLDRHVADEASNPLALLQDQRMRRRWWRRSRTCPSASST
jgi:RNA polymerase sigma factor for flagellar operon FliA